MNEGGKWFSSSKEMGSNEFGLIELFRNSIENEIDCGCNYGLGL